MLFDPFWVGAIHCCNSHVLWWFVLDRVLDNIVYFPVFLVIIYSFERNTFSWVPLKIKRANVKSFLKHIPLSFCSECLQTLLISFSWDGPVPMSQTFTHVSFLTNRMIHTQSILNYFYASLQVLLPPVELKSQQYVFFLCFHSAVCCTVLHSTSVSTSWCITQSCSSFLANVIYALW